MTLQWVFWTYTLPTEAQAHTAICVKKSDLKSKARKLIHQDNLSNHDYKLKELQIKLIRLEDEQKSKHKLKDLWIKLIRMHENKLNYVKATTITLTHTNGDAISNTTDDLTALPKDSIDSDDTEIYELTEQTIGMVMILDKKAAKLHIDNHRTPFRCPEKSCNM